MKDRQIVHAGVNIFKCDCREGSVPIPVSMTLMAKLRCGAAVQVTGECHLAGHKQTYTVVAWPPFPKAKDQYIRV